MQSLFALQMDEEFIIVEYGMPHVASSLPNYESMTRLALTQRTWENVHAFDEAFQYKLTVESIPHVGRIQKALAHTIYNPRIRLSQEWKKVGECKRSDVISLVSAGLEHDDDVIQQWFGADDILKLMNAANSWCELKIAVACICGGHETDESLMNYIRSVLPRYDD